MFKKILIPVDLSVSGETQKLLGMAKSLSQNWDCESHVLSVVPSVGMAIVGSYFEEGFESESRTKMEEQLSAAVAEAGIEAQEAVLMGTVYDCVIKHASDIQADLIILGAHQPELRDYLLGSNAARVVRHSNCSVLVIRD
jgi:nucleotide-binding universal stress UspA family protein